MNGSEGGEGEWPFGPRPSAARGAEPLGVTRFHLGVMSEPKKKGLVDRAIEAALGFLDRPTPRTIERLGRELPHPPAYGEPTDPIGVDEIEARHYAAEDRNFRDNLAMRGIQRNMLDFVPIPIRERELQDVAEFGELPHETIVNADDVYAGYRRDDLDPLTPVPGTAEREAWWADPNSDEAAAARMLAGQRWMPSTRKYLVDNRKTTTEDLLPDAVGGVPAQALPIPDLPILDVPAMLVRPMSDYQTVPLKGLSDAKNSTRTKSGGGGGRRPGSR